MAAERQIPASSARRHCPIKREEFGSETWKRSCTCLGHWDNEAWSVRAQLGDTSPKPSPPSSVPGAEAPSESKKKWLWAPRFGTRICGERGAIWEPPSCESWLQGPGWGWFVWRAAGGVWAECPRATAWCWGGGKTAPFGIMSLPGKTVGSQLSGCCPVTSAPRAFQVGSSAPPPGCNQVWVLPLSSSLSSQGQIRRPFPES